jgi:two-component system chemotaxis response regulator CheY
LHNVLIVEDSNSMRSYIASSIEEIGEINVVESASGFEALKMLPRHKFNLILTDINMPDINGLELVAFVRRSEEYKAIPIVIISTEGSARDRQKGFALGANEYLAKPFKSKALQEIVRKLLGISNG